MLILFFSINISLTHSRVVLSFCAAGIQSWNGDAGLSMLDNETGFSEHTITNNQIQSFILTYWPHFQPQAVWRVCVQWIMLNEF